MLSKPALRKRKIISLSCFILILLISHIPLRAGDNSCSLGDVRSIDDNSISVEIQISNTDTLAGFQIAFSFDYGDITVVIDSMTYIGGACEDFDSHMIRIDNENGRGFLAALYMLIPDDNDLPLLPGIHTVATAYFTFDDVDPNRSLTFEETVIPDKHRDYSLGMWTPAAQEVPCRFNFASLQIR